MKSNCFPKQKNLVRSEALFLFLQVSLTSGLKEEKSWIFPFAFTFSLLQCVVLVEVQEENSDSHRYLVGKRRSVLISFSDNFGYFSFLKNKFILFIYLFIWLRWVFLDARRLSLVAASGGYSSLWHVGFSVRWLLLLWSTGSWHVGSVVVAHRLSCSAACEIFPDQGSNLCPLHWQADS